MTYDWEKHKETLRGLYEAGMTYKNIREYMIVHHSFDASINSYKDVFTKRWKWRRYNRGATADGYRVKRKSCHPKRSTLAPNGMRKGTSQESGCTPSPGVQEQLDREQENIDPFDQPLQDVASIHARENQDPFESLALGLGPLTLPELVLEPLPGPSRLQPITIDTTPGNRLSLYLENSPKWWEDTVNPLIGRGESTQHEPTGCLWNRSTPQCQCSKDFGSGGRYEYVPLPDKLRLLKIFGAVSLVPVQKFLGLVLELLRILDTILRLIEAYLGVRSWEPIDDDGFKSYRWSLFDRIRARAKRLGRVRFGPENVQSIEMHIHIFCLGHMSLALVLPTIVFSMHLRRILFMGSHGGFVGEVCTVIFNLLVQMAMGEGLGWGGDIDSLPDDISKALDGPAASIEIWGEYLFLIVQSSLHPRLGENSTLSDDEFTLKFKTFTEPDDMLFTIGRRILSKDEKALFATVSSILDHRNDPPYHENQQQRAQETVTRDDIARNWPREMAGLEQYKFAMTKLARATTLVVDDCQKAAGSLEAGDSEVAFEIYKVFHRGLVSVYRNWEVYVETLREGLAGKVLSEFSTFCIENDMHEEEVDFLEEHLQRLDRRTKADSTTPERAIGSFGDFFIVFDVVSTIYTRNHGIRTPKQNSRLKRIMGEVWDNRGAVLRSGSECDEDSGSECDEDSGSECDEDSGSESDEDLGSESDEDSES
ncbi:hypothetical protein TWF481_012064 [Arthrobotrys musiformis]|uniref:Clr5 domain-containing protein n=1 Tax=Arthrobotrys musiformis TaxID=47236 RepID=A0AAV9VW36_9PEZI